FREATHEVERRCLFRLEDAGPSKGAVRGVRWLRAHEHRRHDNLVADDQAVDVQVVAIELPTPGLVQRRSTENTEPVQPLSILLKAVRELAERVIEPHDIACRLEAAETERLFQ